MMATTAALPGRISAFVQWVVRTPWPLFTLSMLQADIIGGLFVLGFLRYGLPPQDRIQLQDLPISLPPRSSRARSTARRQEGIRYSCAC